MTGHRPPSPADEQDPAAFWEERYAGEQRVWSGRANAVLEAEVASMQPGTALDLGCGEGGDTAWLADQGWQVTAIDIASGAIERARRLATERGIAAQRITWQQADLASWQPIHRYDLVSACFLHSPVAFARTEVLRRVAEAVNPGGHLLIVGHAGPPPWAEPVQPNPLPEHDGHGLPTAHEQLAELDLPPERWEVVICEDRPRKAIGPQGEQATIADAVVLVRHRQDERGDPCDHLRVP